MYMHMLFVSMDKSDRNEGLKYLTHLLLTLSLNKIYTYILWHIGNFLQVFLVVLNIFLFIIIFDIQYNRYFRYFSSHSFYFNWSFRGYSFSFNRNPSGHFLNFNLSFSRRQAFSFNWSAGRVLCCMFCRGVYISYKVKEKLI